MDEPTPLQLFDLFDRQLYRISVSGSSLTAEQIPQSSGSSVLPAVSNLGSGEYVGDMSVSGGAIQSVNFKTGTTGWRIDSEGNSEFNNGTFRGSFNIGGTTITISNTEDIQENLDIINTAGGGTLYLLSDTFTLTSAGLTMYSGVALVGTSPSGTILDFNNTSGKITIAGTHRYSTGTITSITSGVTVIGSGTSWLANVVAGRDSFFINGQWMVIAVVTDDTHITLAEGYDGATIGAGSAYRISSTINNVTLKGFNAKNSTGSVIDIDDARFFFMDSVWLQDNNIGLDVNYLSECQINNLLPLSNTSHGVTVTNGGRYNWTGVNSVVNGGSGVVLNSVRSMGFSQGVSNSNTTDGFNMTSCTDISLTTFDASSNGGQGIECVSGNTSLTFFDAGVKGNTSDGLKLTATSDNCIVSSGNFEGNGGYGINIAASTCDNSIITSNTFASNSSGAVSDSGTGTVIRGNVGTSDTTISVSNIQTYTPSAAGTATLDLSKGNVHHITMPAGNITIAISNGTLGQCFIVRILQDGTGSRTVTWFSTIKWSGGSAPILTTTASKIDTFGFEVTTVGSAYDGFVIGQNI